MFAFEARRRVSELEAENFRLRSALDRERLEHAQEVQRLELDISRLMKRLHALDGHAGEQEERRMTIEKLVRAGASNTHIQKTVFGYEGGWAAQLVKRIRARLEQS